MIIFSIKKQNKSSFMILVMFLLILTSFSTIQTPGAYEIGEDLDQTQGEENYGYYFDDTAIRWQEFKPLYSTLTRLDLNVDKIGNPGNMLVNITDGQQSLWNTTVLEADIANGATWVNVSLESALPLIPEQSYYIYVRSDKVWSANDRFTWDGHLNSNFTRGVSSIASRPDFDFTFVTWSLSNDRNVYLDQIQNGYNYGYWFDDTVIHWQEFKPLYSTLTRLDLYIQKAGSPGNMLVNITDGTRVLWQTTVLEADIVTGWVNISVDPMLPLIPEQSYYIYVGSDTDSISPSDRYSWLGSTVSNYYRGTTSVGAGLPRYDFAYRMWSVPSNTATYLDQVQEDVNYGFVFSDSWNAWQEFKPIFTTLTQLDLNIQRLGDPGNVLVNITDGQTTLWNTTILEAEIPAPGGWVTISFPSALPLIPGNSYFIYVRSVDPHVPATHYYAWMGHTVSNYIWGDTNVQSGWPTYDYAFRTWIQSSDLSGFLDQAQEEQDYGYWFDDTVVRWQVFRPFYTTLTQVDLYIQKTGNPGNVLINITDGQITIWQTTVLEADITSGWVNIQTNSPVPLIPEQSYYIYVWSDTDSASPSDRYFLRGSTVSNYNRGITSEELSLPGFDFTFRTISLFCDRSVYLDQAQDGLNYGYAFEETVIHWQEFVPLYTNITQIDLYLQKNGNPGNVLVNITDDQNTLWQATILETDIVTGWVPILVPTSLSLIPGQSYFIYVWSDSPSPDVNNRYVWRGYYGSNYYRGVSSGASPGFDFEFRTWGQFFDPLSPEIIITSPTNSTFASSSILLDFTVNEPTSWIGYSLDGAPNVTITENTLLNLLSESSHHVIIYARDLAGNIGDSSTVWFTVDTLIPSISLTSPSNSTFAMSDVWLTFTIDEPTSWIGYSLDGAPNVTITENTLLSSLSEGSHSIILYANDTVNHMGSSSLIWFTVDTPLPVPAAPTLVSPTHESSFTDTTPMLTWNTVSGAAEYNVQIDDNNAFISPDQSIETTNNDYTATILSPGTYYWRVRAANADGSWGAWSAVWSFTIEVEDTTTEETTTTPESTGPSPAVSSTGFEFIGIIGLLLLSVVTIRKRRKR